MFIFEALTLLTRDIITEAEIDKADEKPTVSIFVKFNVGK
jgi:hypothetical protein